MLPPGGQLVLLTYSSAQLSRKHFECEPTASGTGDPDPDVVFCQPSTQPLPVNYRIEGEHSPCGEYAKRDRTPGTDVDVCFSGRIAVTQLRL